MLRHIIQFFLSSWWHLRVISVSWHAHGTVFWTRNCLELLRVRRSDERFPMGDKKEKAPFIFTPLLKGRPEERENYRNLCQWLCLWARVKRPKSNFAVFWDQNADISWREGHFYCSNWQTSWQFRVWNFKTVPNCRAQLHSGYSQTKQNFQLTLQITIEFKNAPS